MSEALKKYADLYRQPGPWCLAYLEASTGTVDSLEAGDVQPDNVRDALAGQGASKEDLAAMESAIQPAMGLPAPVSRFVLVRDGQVMVNELLPGPLSGSERISMDSIPDLLPLMKHQPDEFPYVVAEVSREEGEIRLHRAGRQKAEERQHVQGSDENLKKVPSGGWSQGRYQHHTEEIWRRNADQVVNEIDKVVREKQARLLVLAGDILRGNSWPINCPRRARPSCEWLTPILWPLVPIVKSSTTRLTPWSPSSGQKNSSS